MNKTSKADFHIHTHHSDGSDSLKAVISKAKKVGLTHIAITNHDTILGWEEIEEEQAKSSIHIIPAMEVSCYDYDSKRKVHLLAYGMKKPTKILQLCNVVLEQRSNTTINQLEILIEYGLPVSHKELYEKSYYSSGFYKQHIMNILMDKEMTDSVNGELYQELFKQPGVCSHLDIEYIDVFDAIAAIRAEGGLAVIAHPGQTKSFERMDSYIQAGIGGIECYHFDHSESHTEQALTIAKSNNLFIFGGSDYHGSNGPDHLGKIYIEDDVSISTIMEAIAIKMEEIGDE